jgi:acetyl esterase/lipase
MPVSRRSFASLSVSSLAVLGIGDTALAAAPGDSASSSEERDGILVPEHFVPTPTTISPQAQAMLRSKLPVGGNPTPKSRSDAAGWAAYRKAGDTGMIMMTRHYATQYPGEVVTHQLSASKLYEITPGDLAAENRGRAIYYVHGGGFTLGGGEAAIYPAMQMAGMAKCKVYSIDYRLAPEFPFPVPLDDTLEGYRFILGQHDARRVGVFGPSAGANLVPAMVLKARDLGVPMPATCAMHSCPSDMSQQGDTGYTNDTVDIILKHASPELSRTYAGDHDLKDPYLSPVYADYAKGFPPSVLTSGTRDLLLSGTVRLHRAMVRAGVKAELHVWEAMTHAPFFNAPEEQELYMQHIDFMLAHMARA